MPIVKNFKSNMRMFGITLPLVVASIDYRNEQTSRSPLLRGLGLRSIVAPEEDQLDGKGKLATIKEGFFEDVISSSEKQRTKWSLCGNQYCMEKQYCTAAKECICQEGYESDGGQGCQDMDECASDNYPCPGTRGIESFCENRDPDNSYYKCSCYPGYAAILPEAYNETETGIPISFRPESCEATPLVQTIVLEMSYSSDDDTTFEEYVKLYEQELLASLKSSINIQFSTSIDSATIEVSLDDIRIHSTIEISAENSVSENGSSRRTQSQNETIDIELLQDSIPERDTLPPFETLKTLPPETVPPDMLKLAKLQISLIYRAVFTEDGKLKDLKYEDWAPAGEDHDIPEFLFEQVKEKIKLFRPTFIGEVFDSLDKVKEVLEDIADTQDIKFIIESSDTSAPSPPPSARSFRKLAERMNEYYTISHSSDHVRGQT